jgi:hypothetical protein
MSIDGTMGMKERRTLIDGLRSGALDGLTSCDLTTYGLDVPRVEYGFSLRPTLSRTLYFQMVGRILRPYVRMRCPTCGAVRDGFHSECPVCHARGMVVEYEKKEALFFDHVNMIQEHQDPRALTDPHYKGIPLFKIEDLDWNFKGITRRKRVKVDPSELRLCPHLDYQYCDRPTCAGCDKRKPGEVDPRSDAFKVVETTLVERKGPVPMAQLEPEERREVQDRIGAALDAAIAGIAEYEALPKINPLASAAEQKERAGAFSRLLGGPIGELLAVASELGYAPMWVYWRLTEKENKARREMGKFDRLTVNVPLVFEIGRHAKTKDGTPYKSYWAKMKVDELRRGMKEREEEAVV